MLSKTNQGMYKLLKSILIIYALLIILFINNIISDIRYLIKSESKFIKSYFLINSLG